MQAAQNRYLELFISGTGGPLPPVKKKIYLVAWFRVKGGSYVYYRDFGTTTMKPGTVRANDQKFSTFF
jgi:hypothetical protein